MVRADLHVGHCVLLQGSVLLAIFCKLILSVSVTMTQYSFTAITLTGVNVKDMECNNIYNKAPREYPK